VDPEVTNPIRLEPLAACHAVVLRPFLAPLAAVLGLPDPLPEAFEHVYVGKRVADCADNGSLCFVILLEETPVGVCGLFTVEGAACRIAELSYWIGVSFQGRGIGSASVGRLLQVGWAVGRWTEAVARCRATNCASLHILARFGFRQSSPPSDARPVDPTRVIPFRLRRDCWESLTESGRRFSPVTGSNLRCDEELA
jgi:RimJ/RimL family protein N-acetyltransferase